MSDKLPDQAAQELEQILCHLKFGPYIIDGRMSGHPDILRAKAALLALMYREFMDLIGEDFGRYWRPTSRQEAVNNYKESLRQAAALRYGQEGTK